MIHKGLQNRKYRSRRIILGLFLAFGWSSFAQQPNTTTHIVDPAANPEMGRLARVFVGEWNTTEAFTPNEFYPNGAQRRGTARFSLATGGTSLIEEVHSDGSAGKLDFMVIIWWNADAKSYEFFTCGNRGSDPCKIRGTAQWDGDSFVNRYDLTMRGITKKWRDTFSEFSLQSFTLVAAMESNNSGKMETMITTKYIRKQGPF
jgi:hypothetical protein